jgi:hypothetical protein
VDACDTFEMRFLATKGNLIERAHLHSSIAGAWSQSAALFEPPQDALQSCDSGCLTNNFDLSVKVLFKFLEDIMIDEAPHDTSVLRESIAAIVDGGLLEVLKHSKEKAALRSFARCASDFFHFAFSALLGKSPRADIHWASLLSRSILAPILACSKRSNELKFLQIELDDVLQNVLGVCSQADEDASVESRARAIEVAIAIQEVHPLVCQELPSIVYESLCLKSSLFAFTGALSLPRHDRDSDASQENRPLTVRVAPATMLQEHDNLHHSSQG